MNSKKFKNRAGFTLIELIVVIAIMAILAGVAVPVYSGYIEKAEKAADLQLLAAVNSAFGAACYENDEYDLNNLKNDPKIGTYGPDAVTISHAYAEDFNKYFAGNEGGFKYFDGSSDKQLIFSNGAFRDAATAAGDPNSGIKAISYAGQTLYITQKQADALKNNNLADVGAGELLGKVGTVSDIASGLVLSEGSTFYDLVFDESGEYLANLQKTLGLEGKDDEFMALVMDENGFKADILANSLVLSAAQKTQNMDTSFLGTDNFASTLRSELDKPETATDAMAKLALTYGMYTAYVNSEAGKAQGLTDQTAEILENGTFSGMTDVMATLETEEFRDYLASDEGKADMDAYMTSMQIVNDSASSSGAMIDVLNKGFDNDELTTLLGQFMTTDTTE